MIFTFVNWHSPPLTLGGKNEKQPYGPIGLDLEAGNLVLDKLIIQSVKSSS